MRSRSRSIDSSTFSSWPERRSETFPELLPPKPDDPRSLLDPLRLSDCEPEEPLRDEPLSLDDEPPKLSLREPLDEPPRPSFLSRSAIWSPSVASRVCSGVCSPTLPGLPRSPHGRCHMFRNITIDEIASHGFFARHANVSKTSTTYIRRSRCAHRARGTVARRIRSSTRDRFRALFWVGADRRRLRART